MNKQGFTSEDFLGPEDFLEDADDDVDGGVVEQAVADIGGPEEDHEVDDGGDGQEVLVAESCQDGLACRESYGFKSMSLCQKLALSLRTLLAC